MTEIPLDEEAPKQKLHYCESCGGAIRWAQGLKKEWIAITPEPHARGHWVFLRSGRLVKVPPELWDKDDLGDRFMHHRTTCGLNGLVRSGHNLAHNLQSMVIEHSAMRNS